MYIEDRLFSENTEEVLYSVLMDEEELALFSEFQKEFSIESSSMGIQPVTRGGIPNLAPRNNIMDMDITHKYANRGSGIEKVKFPYPTKKNSFLSKLKSSASKLIRRLR